MIKFIKPGIQVIDRLTLKQLKAGTFGWRGKAKDYPGAKEIINMNAQGVTGKKKRKFWIV